MIKRQTFLPALVALLIAAALLAGRSLGQASSAAPEPGHPGDSWRSLRQAPDLWSDPLQLSEAVLDATNPVLAVDSSHGTLHAVWEEDASLRYAYRDSGGWHLDPYPIPGESPDLAVDCDGVPHLVYVDVDGDIQHACRGPKGWGAPSNISSTSGQSNHPDIALTSDRGIHVVWSEKIGEDYRIYHASSLDNGAVWAAIQPIPGSSGYAPSLAWGPTGRLMVAWQNSLAETDGVTRLYSAEYAAPLWTEPITVPFGLGGTARDPDLGIDPHGRAHLVWEEQGQDGASSIYYAQNAAGAWAAPLMLSSASDRARYPSIATGPTSGINAAWTTGYSLLQRHAGQGDWETPEPVITGQEGIRQVALAVDAQRVAYVAWSARSEGGVWNLFFSQRLPYEVPTPTAPPATATPEASATPVSPLPNRSLLPSLLRGHGAAPPLSRAPHARTQVLLQAEPPWSWSSPTNISSTDKDSHDVALAVGQDGTVYAVWEESYSPTTSILWHSRLQNGTWTTADDFFVGKDPCLAVDPGGTIHLVFSNEIDGDDDIFHGMWDSGSQTWLLAAEVSYTMGRSVQPALAVKSDGSLVVVWSETLEGRTYIYRALENGDSWSTFPIDASGDGEEPDVAVERGDRIWVAWQVAEGGQYNIYATYSDTGGHQWDLPVNVSFETGADAMSADIVGTSSLGAFVVWRGYNTSISQAYFTHNMQLFDFWEAPANVSQTQGSASRPAISIDANGNIHLAWAEGGQVHYRRGNAMEGTWSSTVSIASGAGSVGAPALAVASQSQVHAAWEEAAPGGKSDIYHRAASAPTPTATHTPTPTPTPSPLPYRLGLPLVLKP